MKFNSIPVYILLVLLLSCATAMTPSQVNESLPSLTKTKYFNQAQANEVTTNGNCKILIKGRTYVAPMGYSVQEDLKNGAKGIDEWVQMDGGNAYVLVNFKWINVGYEGATQLHLDFDTMFCE